ncbi:hypothetical protein C8R45DRAFT_1193259 [Mycena sanguinolenta]|nr:hypothetical protein C8R45DRAFT_1193259 [Mycena sanguinolenta]
MAPIAVSPALPPELERAIFEIVALSWPRLIPKLTVLVAWRVKSWVEPLLYRTIIVGSYPSYDNPLKRHFRFPLPRHLHLAHGVESEAAVILSACSAVENLWLAAWTPIVVSETDLSLKRLHASLKGIFGSSPIDFSHHRLSSITHLEIFDVVAPDSFDMGVWSALAYLPNLIHLAFNSEEYLSLCLALLPAWELLHVLVILFSENIGAEDLLDEYHVTELVEDPRFVVMTVAEYIEDWAVGAHIGWNYFARAERHVARRRSGEVNCASSALFLRPVDVEMRIPSLARDCYVPDEAEDTEMGNY